MRKFRVIIPFMLLFHGAANAAITVTGVGGVSSYAITNSTSTPGTGTGTTPGTGTTGLKIYGGTAGTFSGSGATCTGATTCDTCAQFATLTCSNSPICACNRKAIVPALNITITVSKSTATLMRAAVSGTGGTTDLNLTGSTASSVSFTWLALCSSNSGPTDCQTSTTYTVTIYDDKNSSGNYDSGDEAIQASIITMSPGDTYNAYGQTAAEGLGQYTPFPGDERIYFINLKTTGGFPALGYNASANRVRAFVSDKDLDNAVPGKTVIDERDMNIPTGGLELEHPFIDGLTNDKSYYVRLALVDLAENVVQFFPDDVAARGTDPTCFAGAADPMSCAYAVTPEQVLGILTKDFNCFIATAAYGSSLEPKLRVFREFRDNLLLHSWGKNLVLKYYEYGPYAARYIASHPVARVMARGALWPVYGFTYLSLQIGLTWASFLAALLLTALSYMTYFAMRRLYRRV